jgi:hypothetical protein
MPKDAHPHGKRVADENHMVARLEGERLGRGINQGAKNTADQNGDTVHGKTVSRPANQGKSAGKLSRYLDDTVDLAGKFSTSSRLGRQYLVGKALGFPSLTA